MAAVCEHMLKVMLWDALRLLLLLAIRSKRSAEGGWLDVGAGGMLTSINRFETAGWALEEGGLVEEKAFQSPNSPLPVDREPGKYRQPSTKQYIGYVLHTTVVDLKSYRTRLFEAVV